MGWEDNTAYQNLAKHFWINFLLTSSLNSIERERERERGIMVSEQRRTLILVFVAGILERADETLLPMVYKEVGAALHVGMGKLGSLTLFRTIVQSACYPLAVSAGARHNRCHVIAAGAFLWALATFLVAVSSTYAQIAMSRAFNGIGLALVAPAIQSLIADCTQGSNRGSAFGWLQLTGIIGGFVGGMCSLLLASHSFMGIDGWRLVFLLVGVLSIIVGILVAFYGVDPHFLNNLGTSKESMPQRSMKTELKELVNEAREVMIIPSFQIVLTQGVTGSFPWSALSFAPMWLELIGFSHELTGLLFGMFVLAFALGGPVGGKIGDFLSERFPNSGRIAFSQISSGFVVPLAAVLMLVLPNDPTTGFSRGLVFFSMGLSFSWNAAANGPIYADIVPEKSRTSIYALAKSIESILGSFALPIVGILADAYGYEAVPDGSSQVHSTEKDQANAASLAKAICTAITMSMSLCFVLYFFLYCTYSRDRERAQIYSSVDSEMLQISLEKSHDIGDNSEVQLRESCGGGTAIDIAYGKEYCEMEYDDAHALLHRQVVSKNEKD